MSLVNTETGEIVMTATIPTSGPTRRRAKAIARRQWVVDMDARHALRQDRLPHYWQALDSCPCGRVAWLLDGATDEERAEFYRDSEDHAAYCEAAS